MTTRDAADQQAAKHTTRLQADHKRKPKGTATRRSRPQRSALSSARDQVHDQQDHPDDEQNVDEAATNVKREAEQPEDEHDYEDCPEHSALPFL
jgi:hypothetical protein